MYVTLATPTTSPLYYTTVHIATAGPPQSAKNDSGNAIWAKFGTGSAPVGIKGWNGRDLIYYPTGLGFGSVVGNSFPNFLTTASGRCGMVQVLMLESMRVNAIDAKAVTILTQHSCSGEGCAEWFLVKNWTFAPPSLTHLGYTNFKYLFRTIGAYNELVPAPEPGDKFGDLTNATGLAGQNSSTPSQKTWRDHAIVRFNGRWLDSSYGVEYSNEADFQTKALAGWYRIGVVPASGPTPGGPAPDPRLKLLRVPGPGTGVSFNVSP